MVVRRVLSAAVVLAAAALATGCAARDGGEAGPAGTVHGAITMVGGPAGAQPSGVSGTVTAWKGGRKMAVQKVVAGREFSFRLPPARYRLSATGTGLPCPEVTVTVEAATDQAVTLVCSVK